MWNFLIALIIAIIILAFNPLNPFSKKTPMGQIDSKTKDEVNQIQNEAFKQINDAKQYQQQEQKDLDNN